MASQEQLRRQFGAEHGITLGVTADLGNTLLCQHKYNDAESLLRDCLKMRKAKQPNSWGEFYTRSLLGAALLGQKKYAEAERCCGKGTKG